MTKLVPASIHELAFNCPHCDAYTSHTWYALYVAEVGNPVKTPWIPDADEVEKVLEAEGLAPNQGNDARNHFDRIRLGMPFLDRKDDKYVNTELHNTWISNCFVCREICVLLHDRLTFPAPRLGAAPNSDIPADIKRDVEEARSILNLSPRGAAALLRLAIQKLCSHLLSCS